MADPVTNAPEESRVDALAPSRSAFELLRRPDFRRVYVAVSASELGDALQYIALMWFAFEAGGPLGVLAVRLADSVPALVFGLHGGLVADRWDRKRVLITTDLIRAGVLVPVAIAGLAGELPLWGLVVAAFLLTSATSYFDPAYGALLPALVDRENVQQANGLVRATAEALSVGGWAVAAGLLAFLPVSLFFAVNAVTFLVSAAILAGVATNRRGTRDEGVGGLGELAAGFEAIRARPFLAAAVLALGLAVTIGAGTWIAGAPQLVSENLGRAAGGFSLLMTGYAVGAISAGVFLGAKARAPKGAREPRRLELLPPGVPADRLRRLAGGCDGRRLRRSARREHRCRPPQLGGPGGRARPRARARDGRDLPRAPRRPRDRVAPDRAALRRGRARVRVRDRGADRAARRALLRDVGGG